LETVRSLSPVTILGRHLQADARALAKTAVDLVSADFDARIQFGE
jgi:hypothetical protein